MNEQSRRHSLRGRRDLRTSTVLLRNLTIVALVGHVLVLVATVAAGIWSLAALNLVSALFFAAALIRKSRNWYLIVLGIGIPEVSVHAVVATAILGWESGFHIYVLALAPLVFFYDNWPLRTRAIASLGIVVFYVALAWVADQFLAADARECVAWLRYGNLFVGALVLSAVSYYYGAAVGRVQGALREKNAELDVLARIDALTGLANRREALRLIEQESERSADGAGPFSVALLDVDHFKAINDKHGHDVGDEVLKEIAFRLRSALRSHDSVARWGGEEFLILLSKTDRDGAVVAAEKARQAVAAEPIAAGAAMLNVTVTAGVAVCPPAGAIDAVLKEADRALYCGKENGRNQVILAP